jgi:hypothetical protein
VVRTILLEKLLTLKGLREKSAHLRDRVAYFTRWHRASPQVRLEIIEAEGNEWRNDDGEIVGTEIDDYRSNPAALPRRVLSTGSSAGRRIPCWPKCRRLLPQRRRSSRSPTVTR